MMPSNYNSSSSGGGKWFNFLSNAQAGTYSKSALGGFLTIVAAVIICLLCKSEIESYRNPPSSLHMTIEKSMEISSVQLKFDIDFFDLSCDSISFFQEATRGSLHSHEPEHLQKEPISFRGVKDGNNKTDTKNAVPIGCRVFGHALIDKTSGNFKLGKTVDPPLLDKIGKLVPDDKISQNLQHYSISHRINHVMFLPLSHPIALEEEIEGTDHLLNGHKVVTKPGVAVHQYSLQVVETELSVKDTREYVKAHQYSVTQRDIDINVVSQGVAIQSNNIKNFWGLVFLYDFNPISFTIKQERSSILSFLGSLCGILGGVFTMFSLFERVTYTTSKKLMGKKD